MSPIISDPFLVHIIFNQISINSLSANRLKSPVCNQASYNTWYSSSIHFGTTYRYEKITTYVAAKKYGCTIHILTNKHSVNKSPTKSKKLEIPRITTPTTYGDPTLLLLTTIKSIDMELNKTTRIEMSNQHIEISR